MLRRRIQTGRLHSFERILRTFQLSCAGFSVRKRTGDKNNNGGLHNDEQKTKAMEQQLTQLAQENDALRAQLAAAGVEIENVKSELAKTVGERDRFRNELNGAQLDLSNAKRRLDDFRLRQEAIVNALTEAHNTRERILKEANANADRIDAEAKQRRTDILNKAQAALESAKKKRLS